MLGYHKLASRIAISLLLCCVVFGSPAFAPATRAQVIGYGPPTLIAISPRVFQRGSPDTPIKLIARLSQWPPPEDTETEVLWNAIPLSATYSSGIYQAVVPAVLLVDSQPVTVNLRLRNTLTGDFTDGYYVQDALVTDIYTAPSVSPNINVTFGDWWQSVTSAYISFKIKVTDRFGLPLASAPISAFIISNPPVNSERTNTDFVQVVYSWYDGIAEVPIYIDTLPFTQTMMTIFTLTLSTIYAGEFATTQASTVLNTQRVSSFMPLMHNIHPLPNHDECSAVFLYSLTPSYSRPPVAEQDVYRTYPSYLAESPVPGLTRGIQISNYKTAGTLELYSSSSVYNNCYYGTPITKTLLASVAIPPPSAQPFQWCPPEAELGSTSDEFFVVVRRTGEVSFDDYTISAYFPYTEFNPSMKVCSP